MRFLAALTELPLSLLITSFALACSSLPVRSASLTSDNFKSTIANGVWLIEHFSPYCGHCRAFAPTWEKLVEENGKAADPPGIQLAQVDCAVHGDLCDANDIKGYPTLNIYRNGEFVEQFKGNRDFDVLTAFMAKHAVSSLAPNKAETKQPEPPHATLNPTGTVIALDDTTFHGVLAQGPAFVKFFAPWCGHCKKIAPVWKQLARHMLSKVTIAEVNCEEHGALCKSQGVLGYPSLAYYSEGVKSEYTGGRKLEQLKAFAEKASAPALQEIKVEHLETPVADNQVVYLLLHSASDSQILKTVTTASRPLLGSPPIYTSSSPTLFSRYAIPATVPWAVLALKDHSSQAPTSTFLGSDSTSQTKLEQWLLTNRLPTTLELTQDTFQSVMNASQRPLVVIAAVTKENKEKVAERFKDVGMKWRVRTGGSGKVGGEESGREVVFTWMDGEKWADWMKSMYGVKKGDVAGGAAAGLEGVTVVVADHQKLVYYNTDQSGQPIIPVSTSIFSAVEGAAWGKIAFKHSENFVERMARYLNGKMTAIESYVVLHPLHAVFFVGCVCVLMFLGIRRFVGDGVGEYGNARKGDRLD